MVDSARQIIRWAMPGWTATSLFAGMMLVAYVVHGQSHAHVTFHGVPIYLYLTRQYKLLLALVGAASIPAGFVIYQIYYWAYWFAPFPALRKNPILNPFDRGRQILGSLEGAPSLHRVFDRRLNTEALTPYKTHDYAYFLKLKSASVMTKFRENWNLAESMWYMALADEARWGKSAELLERRNQMLGDIYHSLGANMVAVSLGGAASVAMVTLVAIVQMVTISFRYVLLDTLLPRMVAIVISVLVTLILLAVLRAGRMASFDALLALKHDVISNTLLDRPMKVEDIDQRPTGDHYQI